MDARRVIAALWIAASLGACGTAPSPSPTLNDIRNTYADALDVAVAYVNLPLCSGGAPALCHTQAMLGLLQLSSNAVESSMLAADAAAGTAAEGPALAALVSTLDAFQAEVAGLKTR
jgi:hypothetical protein